MGNAKSVRVSALSTNKQEGQHVLLPFLLLHRGGRIPTALRASGCLAHRAPCALRAWSCGSSGNPTALCASGCLAHRAPCALRAWPCGSSGNLTRFSSCPLPLQTSKKDSTLCCPFASVLRGQDSNLRPPGYEPDEMPLLYPAV